MAPASTDTTAGLRQGDQVRLDEIDLTDLSRFEAGFPHHLFTELRHHAPVWWQPPTATSPGGEGFWVVSRHAEIRRVAADTETYSSERGGDRQNGGSILGDVPYGVAAGVFLNMMDDPRHQRIRQLVSPAVSPRALKSLEQEVRRCVQSILDEVADRDTCDFLVDVAARLPLQVVAMLMGIPAADRLQMIEWATTALDTEGRPPAEVAERTREASASLIGYGKELLADRQRCPGTDILSALVDADIDGSPATVTEAELDRFFTLMLIAGTETTRESIAVGLLALIENPDQCKALAHDRSLMPSAVEEMLRWATPDPCNRRTATRDVGLLDQPITAGDKVTLWWASGNRDEQVFADPFRFDIRRSPNPHLAFGHGTHFCLGAHVARLEMSIMFDEVLNRLDNFELAGPVEWTRSNTHTGLHHLPVSFRRR